PAYHQWSVSRRNMTSYCSGSRRGPSFQLVSGVLRIIQTELRVHWQAEHLAGQLFRSRQRAWTLSILSVGRLQMDRQGVVDAGSNSALGEECDRICSF